jgi:hypothetical protein
MSLSNLDQPLGESVAIVRPNAAGLGNTGLDRGNISFLVRASNLTRYFGSPRRSWPVTREMLHV